MDRKSIIILVLCFVLLWLLPKLVNYVYPPIPAPTNVVSSATSPAEATNPPAAQPAQPAGTNVPAAFVVHTEVPEQLLVVTNDNARYTFTSRGGGLQQVELIRYPEATSTIRRRKTATTNNFATLNSPEVPPVMTILGTGSDSLQGDGVFSLTKTDGGVRAEKTLTNGLTLVKDFQIGTNYLVSVSVRLENRSRQPIALPPQEWIVGTAMPMSSQDPGQGETVLWYDGNRTASVGLSYFNTNTTTWLVVPRTPLTRYTGGNSNVVWVSAQNQFFALATMPTNPAPSVDVRMVNLPPPSEEEIASMPRTVRSPRGLQAAIDYPGRTLAPGQTFEQSFNLFAGPKEYRTLARIGDRFNNNIDLIMGFSGFFGWFARALLAAMNWLHYQVRLPYGWAIVAITVVIKLVFWPLTQYSTRSMKRMQALQPQMKALQEKYKDDPQKLSQKTMEFYRKNKVNPLSGCLPMLLQLPVLWGFYRMLQSAIELRGAPFLWIGDLSKPDTVFVIPGFNFPINPMPLIMGVTMLWQSHLTPPSPGVDPGQQKIMRYMPLIFLVILYNYSSGLALYWTVQNLLSILQTKLIQTEVTPAAAAGKTSAPAAPQKKKK